MNNSGSYIYYIVPSIFCLLQLIVHFNVVFYLTLLLFVGQLFGGMLLDYLVSGDFSLQKVVGGLLVLVGLSYNLWVDSRSKKEETSTHFDKIEGVSSI